MNWKKTAVWGGVSAIIGAVVVLGSYFGQLVLWLFLVAPFLLVSKPIGVAGEQMLAVATIAIFFVFGALCSLVRNKKRGIIGWVLLVLGWLLVSSYTIFFQMSFAP